MLRKKQRSQAMSYKEKWRARFQRESRGQALVLLAISFFALLAFIGLVTDVGSIYISHAQLQRALDAAAVAAANNIKNPQETYELRKQKITEAAREMLAMHDITGVSDLTVYLCDDAGKPASFAGMCPQPGQSPRKLVYVEATQQTPVYFLHIFGVESVPLRASAVGETASVDVVLVFDTSESMGVNTPGFGNGRNFDPSSCNAANSCQPLRQAKDAAKTLVANLFNGYDQVAIVTFDYKAVLRLSLTTDFGAVMTAIDQIPLHNDPAAEKVAWTLASPRGGYRTFNPILPDDRDGDGLDADPGMPCTDEYVNYANGTTGADTADPSDDYPDMWDDNTGDACDHDDRWDAFDWDGDGRWSEDNDGVPGYDDDHDPLPIKPGFNCAGTYECTSLLSTCSGCGIRLGTDELINNGRKDSVWVMIFLSDGIANLSDTHSTFSTIPASFRYGFCGSDPSLAFWSSYCIDRNIGFSAGRFCIDTDPSECPPDSTPTATSGPYSVEDYAMDMVDRAALLFSLNEHEPPGEDITIFSIGLGAASAGEGLLRYMANVGDEGSRANDACQGVPSLRNCGNYYYAPNASYLAQIFENIAGRIFTKISR